MLLASALHHTQWTLHQTTLAFRNQQNLDQLHEFAWKVISTIAGKKKCNLQDFHIESVHPPNVAVKDEVVHILPVNSMLFN